MAPAGPRNSAAAEGLLTAAVVGAGASEDADTGPVPAEGAGAGARKGSAAAAGTGAAGARAGEGACAHRRSQPIGVRGCARLQALQHGLQCPRHAAAVPSLFSTLLQLGCAAAASTARHLDMHLLCAPNEQVLGAPARAAGRPPPRSGPGRAQGRAPDQAPALAQAPAATPSEP